MMPLCLILLPLAGAAACFLARRGALLPRVLLGALAPVELLLTMAMVFLPSESLRSSVCPGWIACDHLGNTVLLVTAVLFCLVSLYLLKWFDGEKKAGEEVVPSKMRNFCSCLLAFMGTMCLVIFSRNLGLMWVAVEATTFVSAPLIMYHKGRCPIEAMWKYLLICSVGIGFALFGTMMLAVSAKGTEAGLSMDALKLSSESLNGAWFKAAFVFILAGYGTKMGLAPFHTWLPDAHSEAPGGVSALLSGALLNCSLLGIIRVLDVAPTAAREFASHLLIVLGVLSLLVAGFFIIRQQDFKRMLAYSSVEHMGILAIFFGLGATDLGMLHLMGHSLIKMALFLLAGNFLLACGTRQIDKLGGLMKSMPRTSWLWIIGILMACGVPPSPLFFSEWMLFFLLPAPMAALVALLLFVVFAGMTLVMHRMAFGHEGPSNPTAEHAEISESLCVVPMVALFLGLIIGSSVLVMYGGLL